MINIDAGVPDKCRFGGKGTPYRCDAETFGDMRPYVDGLYVQPSESDEEDEEVAIQLWERKTAREKRIQYLSRKDLGADMES